MRTFLNAIRSSILVQAILSIALGILLAFWPGVTTIIIVYMLALCLAASGVVSLVAYFRSAGNYYRSSGVLANAIFLLVLAIIVFAFPQVIAGFFSLILGILLVVGGAVNTVRSVELRTYRAGSWIVSLLVSVAIVIGGIVIIINPFETTTAFVLTLGILLIINGFIDLVIEHRLKQFMK